MGNSPAFTTAVNAYAMLGKASTALSVAREGQRLAERHDDLVRTGLPFLRLAEGYTLSFAGRFSEARDVAEKGGQSAVQVGDPGLIAAWSALSGLISQLRGELRAAVTSLRETVAIETVQDPTGSLHLHEMTLAGTLAMSGAVELVDKASADGSGTAIKRLFRPHAEAHRAWVTAVRGDVRGAAEIALGGAEIAREAGLSCMEAVVLYEAARFGAARQVGKRLKVLAEVVEGDLAGVYRDAASALAASDESALLAAADAFATLPAPLLAAEMLTAAGRVAQEAGQARRAGVAFARARELARCCPTARTPGLDNGGGTQQLTPREREIARLAAAVRPDRGQPSGPCLRQARHLQQDRTHRAVSLAGLLDGRGDQAVVAVVPAIEQIAASPVEVEKEEERQAEHAEPMHRVGRRQDRCRSPADGHREPERAEEVRPRRRRLRQPVQSGPGVVEHAVLPRPRFREQMEVVVEQVHLEERFVHSGTTERVGLAPDDLRFALRPGKPPRRSARGRVVAPFAGVDVRTPPASGVPVVGAPLQLKPQFPVQAFDRLFGGRRDDLGPQPPSAHVEVRLGDHGIPVSAQPYRRGEDRTTGEPEEPLHLAPGTFGERGRKVAADRHVDVRCHFRPGHVRSPSTESGSSYRMPNAGTTPGRTTAIGHGARTDES